MGALVILLVFVAICKEDKSFLHMHNTIVKVLDRSAGETSLWFNNLNSV